MNSRLARLVITVVFSATSLPLLAQTTYQISSLPGFGGAFSQGNSINNRDWVTGAANLEGDTVSKAALWIGGSVFSLGALGGPRRGAGVEGMGLILAPQVSLCPALTAISTVLRRP